MQSFSVKIDSRIQDLQTITRYLENKCQQNGTVFVYGRGKRKSKNQKYFELFRKFQERQVTYDWHTASFRGRNNWLKDWTGMLRIYALRKMIICGMHS